MTKQMTDMARQGDVLLRRVETMPDGLPEVPRDQGRVVLAYGEVTGHAHAFYGRGVTMFMDTGSGSGARFLRVDAGDAAPLQHEEHATVHVPPGDYQIIQQREYAPEAIRNVAD